MAANDGTKAGSVPEGVGVGSGVGVGESPADGVGVGDAVEEGEALGVDVGGLTAAVGVQPAMTSAMAIGAQAWAIRRE